MENKLNYLFAFLQCLTAFIIWIMMTPIQVEAQEFNKVSKEWQLPHEIHSNQSINYETLMQFCKKLAQSSEYIRWQTFGQTDGGNDLHYLIVSDQDYLRSTDIPKDQKIIWWINNGIHPGEPEGIDATLAFLRDLHLGEQLKTITKDMVLIVVPVYNVDGMLHRNSHSRVNQNGPEVYGFRANASNLDLNRDFIKCKSREAQAFNKLFNDWHPDVFLDHHTSNGADYQHIMTLLPTQPDKLGGPRGQLLRESMLPFLYDGMEKSGYPMTPYVQSPKGDPLNGILGFYDTPRYSSGYAAMYGSLSMMTETHMLKPFNERLNSTYQFMNILLQFLLTQKEEVLYSREAQIDFLRNQTSYPLQWKRNDTRADTILFHGFEINMEHSPITGQEIRRFNRDQPFRQKIAYYNHFSPVTQVPIPDYYVIPAHLHSVIDRLKWNGVRVFEITKDTLLDVLTYSIADSGAPTALFEGQYYRSHVEVQEIAKTLLIRKGNLLVPTQQNAIRYILETLEPLGEDSFLRWNFFDAIFNRKEYFSDYLFEPIAMELLKQDPKLSEEFELKIENDPEFASSPYNRLAFIYNRSQYAEPQFRQYPIMKINSPHLHLKIGTSNNP